MNRVLLQLQDDHRHIADLLDVLEQEMADFASSGDIDIELVLGIMDYIKYYPDVFHHPLEELVFDHLLVHEDAVPAIEALQDEHVKLPVMAKDVRLVLMRWRREGELADRTIADELARAYVNAQRRHMKLEQDKVFPLAIEKLDESDWEQIDEYAVVSAPTSDPIFGPNVYERYRQLRRRLRQRVV